MNIGRKRVFFFDLDGTLIETASSETFPLGVWDMRIRTDVLDRLKKIAKSGAYGITVIIVTNQGGIETGYVRNDRFVAKMDYIVACIKDYVGDDRMVVKYEYCTSNDKECRCRKPNTGMFDKSVWRLPKECADKDLMVMIGDASGKPGDFSDSDRMFAMNAGIDYMDVDDFIEAHR